MQQPCTHQINASMFRKEISCLRIEASFVLRVPKRKLDSKVVMASMERLLGRDLNLLFGHGGTDNILARTLDFMSVNDWLQQVRKVREMLTRRVADDEERVRVIVQFFRVSESDLAQTLENHTRTCGVNIRPGLSKFS